MKGGRRERKPALPKRLRPTILLTIRPTEPKEPFSRSGNFLAYERQPIRVLGLSHLPLGVCQSTRQGEPKKGRTAAKVWEDGDWLSVGRKYGSKGNITKTTAMVLIKKTKNLC